MAIFSKFRAGKKAAEQVKQQQAAAEDKPAPAPYKHVPKHAASDSSGGARSHSDQEQILYQNQQRMSRAPSDSMGNPSMAATSPFLPPIGGFSQDMMPQQSPSARSSFQQPRATFNGMPRAHSTDFFVTDPEAPPLPPVGPTSPLDKHKSQSMKSVARSSSGYFMDAGNSFNNGYMGNPKMKMAAQDRGYLTNTGNTDPTDSAYASVAHSRAPSMQTPTQEVPQQPLPKQSHSNFLPELDLGHQEPVAATSAPSTSYSNRRSVEASRQPLPMNEPVAANANDYYAESDRSETYSQRSSSRQLNLQRVESRATTRSVTPSIHILEGLKVNKKGKLLDEEGDPVGELVDGDMLDCVRQRANAHGEVLDDSGNVVGHVRTITRIIEEPEPYVAPSATYSPNRSSSQPPSRSYSGFMPDLQPYNPPAMTAVPETYPEPIQAPQRGVSPVQEASPIASPAPQRVISHESLRESNRASQREMSPMREAAPYSGYAPQRSMTPVREASVDSTTATLPTMNTLPDTLPQEGPAAFSYKGPVPVSDGPPPEARGQLARRVSAQAPPLPRNNSGSFPQMNPSQFSQAAGAVPGPSRRSSTQATPLNTHAPPMRPAIKNRFSHNAPLGRSPLASSQENSPIESEESGGSDTSSNRQMEMKSKARPNMPAWQPSSNSVPGTPYSYAQSYNSMPVRQQYQQPAMPPQKPRTYFTHAGRVDASELEKTRSEAESTVSTAPSSASIKSANPSTKKKSRFSFMSKSNAVAAH